MIENYLNAGADFSHKFPVGELFFEKRRASCGREKSTNPIKTAHHSTLAIFTAHTKSARAQKHTKFKHRRL